MSDEEELAERVVHGMLEGDGFSAWCGMEVLEIAPRRSVVQMRVRAEMANGFGVSHGGIVYSLADSALAFAANTHGKVTVAIENSISYPKAVRLGDVITPTTATGPRSRRSSVAYGSAFSRSGPIGRSQTSHWPYVPDLILASAVSIWASNSPSRLAERIFSGMSPPA